MASFILLGVLKKETPLSSAVFIIFAEVLSKALNVLFDDLKFVGFGLPKWSAQLNHLE